MSAIYELAVYPKWENRDPEGWFILKWKADVPPTFADMDALLSYMRRTKHEGRSIFVFMFSKESGSSGSTEFYDWHLTDNDLIHERHTIKALYWWTYHIIEELV